MDNSNANEGRDAVPPFPNDLHTHLAVYSNDQLPRYSWTGGGVPTLPRYSAVFDVPERPAPASGSPRSATTIHEYHLKNGKTPWATLKVSSRAGTSTNSPKFIGGDVVSGSVVLDLNSSQTLNAIDLLIRGRIITGPTEYQSYTFLSYQTTVWSKVHGDPRQVSSGPSTSKFDGRLAPGEYTWPFSFDFPTEAALPGESRPFEQYRIPHTFRERGANVSVLDDLTLHLVRGKLRADDKIRTPVVYIPKITPDPFSHLRQLAYRENTALPGPTEDPTGWFTLPVAKIRGVLFQQRTVELDCQLSIARPLCYTQGTIIPCSFTIQSVDTQALDVLVSPKAVMVALRQCVKYFSDARQFERNAARIVDVTDIETAVWSPPFTTALHERRIEGEIHLPRELQPSSDFAALVVEYTVHVLPPESPVFSMEETIEALPSQSVTIATTRAPGPTPREYTIRRNNKRAPTFDTVPIFMNTGAENH